MSDNLENIGTPETPKEIFAIPLDREAVQSYFLAVQMLNFVLLGLFTFGIAFVGWWVYYFVFGKWLIERQSQEFNYRLEGRTLRIDWGVFFLKRKAIPLDRVTDFVLVQGPIMRMFHIWSLQVQTASTGTNIPEATLIAIENPERIRDELLKRRDEAARASGRNYS